MYRTGIEWVVGVSLLLALMVGLGCKPAANETAENGTKVQAVNREASTMEDQSQRAGESGDFVANAPLTEVARQVNNGEAQLVDVRSDEEWNESHFEKAQHISIDKIEGDSPADALAGLDKEKTVYLH